MKTNTHSLLQACAIAGVASLGFGSATAADSKDPIIYKDLVNPILQAKCVSCHGEDKSKGKLRLDTFEAVMKGGSEGDNIIPGKPDDSLSLIRVHYPLDDDDHMPPEDKDQLTKQEIQVLEFWIKSGAKKDMKVSQAKPAGADAEAIKFVVAHPPKIKAKKAKKPKVDPKVAAARAKALAGVMPKVEKAGASLMAIAQDTPELRFSALNVAKKFKDDGLKILAPVNEQILWLDLARTQVTDKVLTDVAAMKNLTRLHLENTKITDAGLAQIAKLSKLEYLNLYGTQVTDAGVMKLAGLKKLKKIFLWQTKVTEKGSKQLVAKITGLDANTGFKAAAVKPVVAVVKKPAAPTKPKAKPAAKAASPMEALGKAVASAKLAANSASKAAADAMNAAKTAQQVVKQAEAALAALKKASTPPKPPAKPAVAKKPVAKPAAKTPAKAALKKATPPPVKKPAAKPVPKKAAPAPAKKPAAKPAPAAKKAAPKQA
ncbi:MAG: hypothetical protein L3J39_00695 [Verrucomicrobiales bacterium]|nr:hypothetical protein [Verrucomicrobiales bacterium]